MDYKFFENDIYIRFDKGDEIISGIEAVCKKEGIKTANVSGIGGCGEIITGTYVLDKHDYQTQSMNGLFEMISLTGNITLKDNEPFLHAHAMFSYIDNDKKVNLIGGHLKKAVILLTGEIVVTPLKQGVIKRKKDDETGLNIWDLN